MGTNDQEKMSLSNEVVDDLLSDQRRRYLLYCLFRYTNPLKLTTVAKCITVWELHTPAKDIPKERLRVYMSLYHDHLPKCEDAGVVTYIQAKDMIELTTVATYLKPYLKRTAKTDFAPPDREWEW